MNPDMANHTYSITPQAVSRHLASKGWTRSRNLRGRLADEHTQGFMVRRELDETVVRWREDSRSYRAVGYQARTISSEERLERLAASLGDRYEVAQRGDALIVSERVLKPEVLSFHKCSGVFGLEYVAETDKHRYTVRRHPDNSEKWELRVHTLKAVGILSPIMVADQFIFGSVDDTKREVTADAHAFLKRQS